MNIHITASVDDPDDEDAKHRMGITNEAYIRLTDALSNAGFSVADIARED